MDQWHETDVYLRYQIRALTLRELLLIHGFVPIEKEKHTNQHFLTYPVSSVIAQ